VFAHQTVKLDRDASHAKTMGSASELITICICSYRRPELLQRLLDQIKEQITGNAFTFSVVVADNDAALSGRPVVEDFAKRSSIPTVYCSEPIRNIALARNRAIEHARGEFVAWIDDDEIPPRDWLMTLWAAIRKYDVAGVLGPVCPHFDRPPPRWLVEGGFCERPQYPSGTVMHWSKCFAGNALLRREILGESPFRAEFGLSGEDVDFFRRMAAQRHVFVWCTEAVVQEVIPPSRWTRGYRFKRALLHGRSSYNIVDRKALAKSVVAIPAYVFILPFTFLAGQHVFMKYGMKLGSHIGRLLALFRVYPVKERPL
jgi:glycosyltransferase involved in cell wall biosynthesis